MRAFKAVALAGIVWSALGSTSFADVRLSIRDGQVTLVAKDATVRQILTEWARVGRTKIVNVERIPGGPITLELTNVSEQQALDVLLRSVSGFMAAPRPTIVSDASQFDRIIVMPTNAAPRSAAVAPPTFNQVAVQPPPQPNEDDGNDVRPVPSVVPRSPIFATFPQPQVVNPQQQGVPSTMPGIVSAPPQTPQQVQPQAGAPPVTYFPGATPGAQPAAPPSGGASAPGMIVQPAQQPANGQRVIVVPPGQL